MSTAMEQDILRLEITINDATAVEILQGQQDLSTVETSLFLTKIALATDELE